MNMTAFVPIAVRLFLAKSMNVMSRRDMNIYVMIAEKKNGIGRTRLMLLAREGMTVTERKFLQMSKVLPEQKRGNISINHFYFTEEKLRLERMRAIMSYTYRYSYLDMIKVGHVYTRLIIDNQCWMSDTPLETVTNAEFLKKANGNVLIFGLGMGLCLFPLMNDPDIKKITCVELNKNLIKMMKPHFKDSINLVHGDAFQIDFGKEKFDTIYFDIWPGISHENYNDMKVLHKKFRKNINMKNEARFINSWMRDECRREYYS